MQASRRALRCGSATASADAWSPSWRRGIRIASSASSCSTLRFRSLPHVAFDLAENERADAAYPSVEAAVQARYDAGRVLLAPKKLVIESDAGHLEEGRDGLLRYRYCKSAVIAAWSIMATPPPPPAQVDTLIVVGADSWLTLDEHADVYREALGERLRLVTVPGGHTVYWDALDQTSDALTAFLA